MKRNIRLTESDLTRIVKRVLMSEMMDVSSDSEYYQSRKRETSIPVDKLGVLLNLAQKWCENTGVKMGATYAELERNAPKDCITVAKLNREYSFV